MADVVCHPALHVVLFLHGAYCGLVLTFAFNHRLCALVEYVDYLTSDLAELIARELVVRYKQRVARRSGGEIAHHFYGTCDVVCGYEGDYRDNSRYYEHYYPYFSGWDECARQDLVI